MIRPPPISPLFPYTTLSRSPAAPRVPGRQRRDQRRPEPEPRAARRHVALGPADLHVERAGLLETPGRRCGQTQHDLAEADQVVVRHRTLTRRDRTAA